MFRRGRRACFWGEITAVSGLRSSIHMRQTNGRKSEAENDSRKEPGTQKLIERSGRLSPGDPVWLLHNEAGRDDERVTVRAIHDVGVVEVSGAIGGTCYSTVDRLMPINECCENCEGWGQ